MTTPHPREDPATQRPRKETTVSKEPTTHRPRKETPVPRPPKAVPIPPTNIDDYPHGKMSGGTAKPAPAKHYIQMNPSNTKHVTIPRSEDIASDSENIVIHVENESVTAAKGRTSIDSKVVRY